MYACAYDNLLYECTYMYDEKNRVAKESKREVQIKESPELILEKVIISEEGPLPTSLKLDMMTV